MAKKVWLISVNMGYGHQRTAYSLKNLAYGEEIINANDYQGIPKKDRATWETTRKFYEFISNFKRTPFFGNLVFTIFDTFQKILSFYPKRDLSKPNFQLKQNYSLIKKGWGRHLIEKLKTKLPKEAKVEKKTKSSLSVESSKLKVNLPIISAFFTPAFMAEFFGYPGEIFCVICDADISRSWASLESKKSKIKYFAPTERAVERLKLYGVKKENIFLTGYPLPLENIGGENAEILKADLKNRLLNLDPQKKYFKNYQALIKENLGKLPEKSDHPLTLIFSVGGAGVQKEIGNKIVNGLVKEIKGGKIKIILVAGIRERVKEYFEKSIKKLELEGYLGQNIEIIFERDIKSYFRKFNLALRKADILWTKPSELSFYSALGLPIIIAPPVGSQEEFNMRWLLKSGFGILQENPKYTKEWLFDWLNRGFLAEMAMEGFIEGEKLGALKIKNIIFSQNG